jgi:signal transduction histidine kinase
MMITPLPREASAPLPEQAAADRPRQALIALLGLACAATTALILLGGQASKSPFLLLAAVDMLLLGAAIWLSLTLARTAPAKDGKDEEIAALSRAKQAAENANLAKSRYLASVSHELRSPLNAIYGYAQLLDRGNGANAHEAARVILRSAEHLTNLIEGLLDISQLESGVLRVRMEEVHLPGFMDQIVSMMRPAALSKGLTFRYEQPTRMPEMVRLDQGRFRQVLINLLSNAIKFTEHGSVTLTLRYSGQIATFEVRDTGPGIPVEDRERIFERFERGGAAGPRASQSSGKVKPGAGLGLAIARTIVEILGGRLELESEVGTGTCFRITLMLSEVAGRVVTHMPARRLLGYKGRTRSVLLVEDDADQRLFMEKLLLQLGLKVCVAPNGEAALDEMAGEPLDLAILDISLPGMSGWETGARLRERYGEPLQILMLSANSDELHRPDFEAPAHDRFLVKPVEFETLIDTIGELLSLTWEWDDPQPEIKSPAAPSLPSGDDVVPHLVRLQEFLRIGYVRGIEAEIRALEGAAPDAQPLVRHLYDCLDRYDLASMARLIAERTEK